METYRWSSEYFHRDNMVTMSEFLEDHLDENYDILMHDGTMAEIVNNDTGEKFEVHASGDGDSLNHKVEFKLITE